MSRLGRAQPFKPIVLNQIHARRRSTITKALTYSVKKTPTAPTKTLKYTVKSTPSASSKALKYSLKTTPSALTKALKYTALKATAPSKSLKYTVLDVALATYVNESMAAAPTTGTLIGGTAGIGWNVGGFLRLTVASSFNNAAFEYTGTLPTNFIMSADLEMGSTSGADATWFYWGCTATPGQEDTATASYSIERNIFGNFIALRFNGVILAQATYTKDTSWDTLKVYVTGQTFCIYYNGVQILQYTDTTPRTLPGTKYGWAARCGGGNTTQDIKNISVTVGQFAQLLTLSARYAIAKATPITKSLRYAVDKPTSITKSLKYTVKTVHAAITKTLKYTIANRFNAFSYNLKYTLKSTPAAKTKALEYTAKTVVAPTKTLKYTVKATHAAVTKSLKYTVIVHAATAFSYNLQYVIAGASPVKTKALKYTVKKSVSTTKGLIYRVATSHSATKTLKYTVTKSTSLTKALKYTVKRPIATTAKSLRYAIKASPSAPAKTLKYTIKAPAVLSKAIIYKVKTGSTKTEALQYDVANMSTIHRDLQYSIGLAPTRTASLPATQTANGLYLSNDDNHVQVSQANTHIGVGNDGTNNVDVDQQSSSIMLQ